MPDDPIEQPDGGYKPPATQEELNSIIEGRIARERAKFGDYDDLKAAAARLDEVEQSTQAQINEAQEQAAEAQAKVDRLPSMVADELRTHLVSVHNIADDDAELFLTADDPELLLKQAQRLVERSGRNNHVPREGSTPSAQDSEMTQFTRQLFSRGAHP